MNFLRRLAFFCAVLAAVMAGRAQSTVPVLTQPLPAQTLGTGGPALTLDLRNYFSLPGVTGQIAQFNTVLGTFNVELLASAAPQTVANFLTYVNGSAYSNSMIHRSASLNADGVSNWIVQGGGYTYTDPTVGPVAIPANAPIPLEYNLPNTAGTIAMARGSATNSATTQWFFNVNDNTSVLGPSNGGGYAVFGRVLGTGLTVLNAMAAVPTYNVTGGNTASPFTNVPLQNITANQTTIQIANLIMINSVTIVPVYPPDNTTPAVFSFAAANNNPAAVAVAIIGSTLTLTPLAPGTATISIRAADTNGNFPQSTLSVTVVAGTIAPSITSQPVSQTINSGGTVVFAVAATGVPTPTYQWRKDGANITGATSATLVLSGTTGATAALAGGYSCWVTNSLGTAPSNTATLTVSTTSDLGRLSNLSVLTDISATVPNFTVGTVIGPIGVSGTKALVVRADGPGLGALGYPGTISDPQLSLFNASNQVIASNDNWGTPVGAGAASGATLLTAMANVGAFALPSVNSLDAVVNPTGLTWGNYSVQVSGVGGAIGNVIAEIYDATPTASFTASSPRLINVSVNKQIVVGGSLTLGFTIGGSTARTVLIRVIGPGLIQFGYPSSAVLADPQLTLYNSSSQVVATNDDWGADPQIIAAGSRVNAFSVGSAATKDAMLLITLPVPPPQGAGYSVKATGTGGTGGQAIVEVYEVP